jgi:integrase/recombinase XerD
MAESATSLPPRPAAAMVARVAGERLPAYVTRDQARVIINAATTLSHRVLLECLWQSGGRVSEVLRLRPCDVDPVEGALMLENRKQKRGHRRKRVYVSSDLVAQLQLLARERRVGYRGSLFGSAKSGDRPMSTVHAWRIVTACSRRSGTYVEGGDGVPRPANGRDFRHGAAVNQVQQGVPLSEVQQQLGHARIDSTTIYTKLANPERRRLADRVAW